MQEAIDAIAHPGRRAMLQLVLDRELPVSEIAERVGLSQPAASQHLKVLRDAGLVRGRVDGRRRLYRVDLEGSSGCAGNSTPTGARRWRRSRRPPRRRGGGEARLPSGADRRPHRGGLDTPHHSRGAGPMGRPGRHRQPSARRGPALDPPGWFHRRRPLRGGRPAPARCVHLRLGGRAVGRAAREHDGRDRPGQGRRHHRAPGPPRPAPPRPSRTTSGDGPTSSATPSRRGPVAPRRAASGGGRRLSARGR